MTATYWVARSIETSKIKCYETNERLPRKALSQKKKRAVVPKSMLWSGFTYTFQQGYFFLKKQTSFVVCFVGCEQKKRGTTTISISVNLFFRGEQTSCACALRGAFVPCHVTPNLTDIMSAESS